MIWSQVCVYILIFAATESDFGASGYEFETQRENTDTIIKATKSATENFMQNNF